MENLKIDDGDDEGFWSDCILIKQKRLNLNSEMVDTDNSTLSDCKLVAELKQIPESLP